MKTVVVKKEKLLFINGGWVGRFENGTMAISVLPNGHFVAQVSVGPFLETPSLEVGVYRTLSKAVAESKTKIKTIWNERVQNAKRLLKKKGVRK